ncbi:MAG TPA: hypothetical protein VHE33_10135 [Acidobacteriaceae bacterium]|nr:hypothetical protein [Acidobacteriaceae bacterium]
MHTHPRVVFLAACCVALGIVFEAHALTHCVFQQAGGRYTGGCGRLFDQTPIMTLVREAAITTGLWRADRHPSSAWGGTMTDDGDTDPLELEVYPDRTGVLRTEYGWFAVKRFEAATAMEFDLEVEKEVEPNSLDAAIIRAAAKFLSSDRVWNRADNRRCAETATTWSIYCAMEKATQEVTGGFHHRRPALEAVREIVDERTKGRPYHHRLMDYNNDPTTHLSDVQSLFTEALARVRREQGS